MEQRRSDEKRRRRIAAGKLGPLGAGERELTDGHWNAWRPLAGLLSVLLALTACSGGPSAPLRVGLNPWFGFAPFHLAAERGLYGRSGPRLVDYESSTQTMRAFQNRNIEVAGLTLDEALMLADESGAVRVVMALDYSRGGDGLIARDGTLGLGDLAGRRIGVENTVTGAYLLTRVLGRAGVARTDVTIVPLPVERQEAAFREGRVDFLVTYDPLLSQLAARGGNVLFTTRTIPGEVVDVLVAHRDTVACCGQRLRAIATGWTRAVTRIREDASVRTDLARLTGLSPAVTDRALAHVRLLDLGESRRLLAATESPIRRAAHRLSGVLLAEAFIGEPLDPAALFDPDALGADAR